MKGHRFRVYENLYYQENLECGQQFLLSWYIAQDQEGQSFAFEAHWPSEVVQRLQKL